MTVFYGAGRYASDSFRIYSPLMPGGGAPDKEGKWLKKRDKAISRSGASEGSEMGMEEVGEWMSDDDSDGKEEEAEWRKVRPTGTPYDL